MDELLLDRKVLVGQALVLRTHVPLPQPHLHPRRRGAATQHSQPIRTKGLVPASQSGQRDSYLRAGLDKGLDLLANQNKVIHICEPVGIGDSYLPANQSTGLIFAS